MRTSLENFSIPMDALVQHGISIARFLNKIQRVTDKFLRSSTILGPEPNPNLKFINILLRYLRYTAYTAYTAYTVYTVYTVYKLYIRYTRYIRRKLNRLIDWSNLNNLESVEIQMTNFVETNDFELRLRYFRPARSRSSIVPFGPRFPLPARSNRIYLLLPRFHSTPCNSNGCLISA